MATAVITVFTIYIYLYSTYLRQKRFASLGGGVFLKAFRHIVSNNAIHGIYIAALELAQHLTVLEKLDCRKGMDSVVYRDIFGLHCINLWVFMWVSAV